MSWLRFYELDDIISGLRYEDGHYDLICLDDKEYITKLNALYSYWKKLKEEIENVRLYGYENTRRDCKSDSLAADFFCD